MPDDDGPRVRVIGGDDPEMAARVAALHHLAARRRRTGELIKRLMAVPKTERAPDGNKE
jgi:hypothetical protein